MQLTIRRIILFVDDLKQTTDFYEKKLGLTIVAREEGFVDFDAGACRLALHAGVSNPGRTKICFYVPDVAQARKELLDKGIRMGPAPDPTAALQLCDGKDPEGNSFQLSNRK
jgi:catechol 2,3-dioxygenase-like lactoylglutathione lyase family enzyme